MNDLLREIFTLCAFAALMTYIVIPIWFVCSCVGLLVSAKRRAKFKTKWPIYLAFGVATLMILYALDLFPPRHSLPNPFTPDQFRLTTPETIQQADAIVEGSFLLDHTVSSSRDVFTGPYYQNLKVNTFVIPFQVDRSVRGPSTGTINVKIFFTFGANTPFREGLPLKEKLLLLLKQDSQDNNTYTFFSQQTGWLVLAHPHAVSSVPSDPNTFVLDDAKGFLAACLDHPGLTGEISYMTQPATVGTALTLLGGGFSAINYPQTDPARLQALRIGKSLGESDPEFLAIAKKFEGEYGEIGAIVRSIRAGSGDYSELTARLNDFNAQPSPPPAAPGKFAIIGNEHFNFPWELSNAITESGNPGKMMPLISQALTSSDPRMREMVTGALRQRQTKDNGGFQRGNQLGNQFYPLLAKLLDDPDWNVQYGAMGCMFEMSGESRHWPPETRELNLWATTILKPNPNLFIAQLTQYKAWWEKQKETLSRTQMELDQIRKGILSYETEYGNPPPPSDNREMMQILQGFNPHKTQFLASEPWEFNAKEEPVDAWGTRLRISVVDPKNPLVQSAGPDKKWDTADDLTGDETP
jgi:hypothetical protein